MPEEEFVLDDAHDDPAGDEEDEDIYFDRPDEYEDYGEIG